jgi:hypothetical protein
MGDHAVRADVTRVTLSAPGVHGEDDDYFSRVWGNPRDMEDTHDLYLLSSTCSGKLRANWSSTSFADGVWSGVTGNVGGTRIVAVLNPGWVSSLDLGEDGQLRPIDTQHYTQLTFRMRVANGAGASRPRIEWANGPIGATGARGIKGFWIEGDGQWHVYSVNLGTDPNWTSGPVSWLWFQLEDLRVGYRVDIDWVRLTPRQTRQVRWQGDALSGSARVYLGPDAGRPERYGDLVLYERFDVPESIHASARSLTVPASLPGGQYYARVEAAGTGANSSDFWRFTPLPIAEIVAPSYTSGEDWATANLGNAWDMEGLVDISVDATEMDAIRSIKVSDGVLIVVSKDDGMADCGVPWPHRPLGLNLGGKRIDQNKYKYFSYRYRVEEAPDQGAGGESRIRWQAQHLSHWPTGRTDDISLHDNDWFTYSVDLASLTPEEGGGLEGEKGEWKDIPADVLQIMLHESHRQWTSHLDWVKLTAENEARGSYVVRWNVLGTSESLKTTLYWARKQGDSYQLVPGSGEVIGTLPAQGVQVAQGHVVYLPYIVGWYAGESDTLQHVKSTQGLSTGQAYYIAIKLEDGYNESMWYSPLPVRVR